MNSLYSCKSEIDASGATRYRITKFDTDMNVEASYLTDGIACECPAGERPACRHRIMLSRFIARGAVNTFWLYDYERNGWVDSGLMDALSETNEEMIARAQPLTIAHEVSFPDDVTGDQIAEAFGNLLHDTTNRLQAAFDAESTGSNPVGAAKINRRGF